MIQYISSVSAFLLDNNQQAKLRNHLPDSFLWSESGSVLWSVFGGSGSEYLSCGYFSCGYFSCGYFSCGYFSCGSGSVDSVLDSVLEAGIYFYNPNMRDIVEPESTTRHGTLDEDYIILILAR